MVGEYLGDGDKQIIEIMYSYVESVDFKGMDFVSALRYGAELFSFATVALNDQNGHK